MALRAAGRSRSVTSPSGPLRQPKGGEMEDCWLGTSIHRHRRPEWMDRPGLDAGAHTGALSGLGRINRVSRSDAILWPSLARLAAGSRGEPIRVLDGAC